MNLSWKHVACFLAAIFTIGLSVQTNAQGLSPEDIVNIESVGTVAMSPDGSHTDLPNVLTGSILWKELSIGLGNICSEHGMQLLT